MDLLSNARAVINLSSAENFNIFLAEACAIGVPIVATSGAAAFCPNYANVECLEPNEVTKVIVKAVSDSDASIFPRICTPQLGKKLSANLKSYIQIPWMARINNDNNVY